MPGVKLTTERLAEIRERASRAMPGPWEWFGDTDVNRIYLATINDGRRFVLEFARWGFRDARLRVQDHERGVMVNADDLARYEVLDGKTRAAAGLPPGANRQNSELYRADFIGIDHPDAEFIAAARDDIETLLAEVDRLRALVGETTAEDDAE